MLCVCVWQDGWVRLLLLLLLEWLLPIHTACLPAYHLRWHDCRCCCRQLHAQAWPQASSQLHR